jgi:hypothetical protein
MGLKNIVQRRAPRPQARTREEAIRREHGMARTEAAVSAGLPRPPQSTPQCAQTIAMGNRSRIPGEAARQSAPAQLWHFRRRICGAPCSAKRSLRDLQEEGPHQTMRRSLPRHPDSPRPALHQMQHRLGPLRRRHRTLARGDRLPGACARQAVTRHRSLTTSFALPGEPMSARGTPLRPSEMSAHWPLR